MAHRSPITVQVKVANYVQTVALQVYVHISSSKRHYKCTFPLVKVVCLCQGQTVALQVYTVQVINGQTVAVQSNFGSRSNCGYISSSNYMCQGQTVALQSK